MSYLATETYDVYNEEPRRAAKPKPCDACKRTIARGEIYMHVSWVYDGRAESVNRCGACQRTHEHLRGLDKEGEMWPDERLGCGLSYESEWGELPDNIAALAFATPREASALLAERHAKLAQSRAEMREFRRKLEAARVAEGGDDGR